MVTFVEITDEDVAHVVALWQTCGLTRPWNDPHADVARARATSTSTVLVARGGDGVVASVMCGHDGHRGWMYYVAVDPTVQGQGLGRAAVEASERWLAAQGVRKARLMVRDTNARVLGFYAALGYADQECVVLGKDLAPA
ncbi:GNAT family acetyltransferase [Sediminihabitans luteus]|uniref:GNAT family acetyltransferase n=1 Tax=Sediminihabitans luteus TaxID=1138585 RepID=UPI001A45638E|nr:GNAT family acetyltransferase [Sediminihabitans luteus]GII98645.1 GNAT family acetyltransferase [Sediminihabitans luteus]